MSVKAENKRYTGIMSQKKTENKRCSEYIPGCSENKATCILLNMSSHWYFERHIKHNNQLLLGF